MDLRALSTVVVMSLLASCGQAELEPEADREAAAPAASNQQLPAARLQMVASPVQQYSRLCDGSAVVAISDDLFLVGNDEKDTLQFYRLGQADPVAQSDA